MGRTSEITPLRVGMTTTIPVEVILAAGATPVDLNNVFVNSSSPTNHVERAERDGYPASSCCWIKGIHSVVVDGDAVEAIVAVTEGDCSTTLGLVETLQDLGSVRVIPFAFPYDGDRRSLISEIDKFARAMRTTLDDAETVRTDLARVRNKLRKLDSATWRDGTVTGTENFKWLVASSDFDGDPDTFETRLDAFM
ncbi:MAG: 2-hydroxyacyl-CoA dehydratase, partial [Candidatus Hydrogenedentes bacterium]|nr:2-hydroxyacyl-CoA dehydratase [Candidatus Hydrogenedentota bacterium]